MQSQSWISLGNWTTKKLKQSSYLLYSYHSLHGLNFHLSYWVMPKCTSFLAVPQKYQEWPHLQSLALSLGTEFPLKSLLSFYLRRGNYHFSYQFPTTSPRFPALQVDLCTTAAPPPFAFHLMGWPKSLFGFFCKMLGNIICLLPFSVFLYQK